jgi:uncharacterized membrane protein YphA (DoxX/SURF4 family)
LLLKAALGALFIAAGTATLLGNRQMVAEFDVIGLGQWFRYFTAVAEIAGGLLILLPKISGYGALILAGVSLGAGVAQSSVLQGDVIPAVVLFFLCGAVAWRQRQPSPFL